MLVGTVAIPDSIVARQRSAAVQLMQQSLSNKGHFAFRSATALVYYERSENGATEQPAHLALEAIPRCGIVATRRRRRHADAMRWIASSPKSGSAQSMTGRCSRTVWKPCARNFAHFLQTASFST